MRDSNFILSEGVQELPNEIALFGGSFNPPHWGHFFVSLKVREAGLPVVIAPVFWLPHKFAQTEKDLELPNSWYFYKQTGMVPFELRYAMCKEMWKGEENIWVSDIEKKIAITNLSPNYTFYTVELLKNYGKKVHLIIGEDNAISFDKWYRSKELLKNIESLWIVKRFGSHNPEKIKLLSKKIKTHFIKEAVDVSATSIRNWASKRLLKHTSEGVINIIKRYELYGYSTLITTSFREAQ